MTRYFSDDFESGNLGAWDGTYGSGGSASVAAAWKRSGAYGASLSAAPGGIAMVYVGQPGLDETWVRTYVRIDAYAAGADKGATLIQAYHWSPAGFLCNLCLRWNNGLHAHLRYTSGGSHFFAPDFSGSNGPLLELGRWYCVELHGKAAPSGAGSAALYIDGVPAAVVDGLSNGNVALENFYLIAENDMTARFDDVALSSARLGPTRGYRVYHNSGCGPVDYATPCAWLADSVGSWTSPALDFPAAWRFGIRAYNEYGEEKNINVVADLTLLGSGSPSPTRPNRPTNLAARAAAGGRIEITFRYDGTGECAPCTHFHVYSDAGTGEVNYASAIGSVARADGVADYAFLTSVLADGATYRFAVRAATAGDVEDDGLESIPATADAVAPAQPASLLARIVG